MIQQWVQAQPVKFFCPICKEEIEDSSDNWVAIQWKGAKGIKKASVKRKDDIVVDAGTKVPTISAYTWWNRLATNDTYKSRSPLSWQSAVCHSGFSTSGQFAAAELIHNSTTKPLRRRPDSTTLLLLLMAGNIHPNPGPTAKYPCPVCARYVTSPALSYMCTRYSGWVHAKCSGLLNAAQYRINKDWTCDPWSASKTQQSAAPPSSPSLNPAPSVEHISVDSTFNVLQFNDKGIGNTLTVLGVVLERNKVKVAVIQESKPSSKLSSKSKNPCIRDYTIVHKNRPHGHGGGLVVFIHNRYSSPNSHRHQRRYLIPTWKNLP